tara:strand:- start:2344 stop:2565 length:222 start_codon:yes stop_codon:yes gene_type:complete
MKNKKQFIKVDLNKQNLNEYITEKRDKIKTLINNFIKEWKQIEQTYDKSQHLGYETKEMDSETKDSTDRKNNS